MSPQPDRDLAALIRNGMPPVVASPGTGDLWPELRPRLDPTLRRPNRLESVLALVVLGLLLLFPEIWLHVLYHL